MFLRLTVIELRRLADREPAISTYLRHVADQIEGEANAVAEHEGGRGYGTGIGLSPLCSVCRLSIETGR